MTRDDHELLRRRWDEGKHSGRAGPLDIGRLIVEERVRFKGRAERRQQADVSPADTEATTRGGT